MDDRAAVLRANEAFYRAFAERDVDAMDRLWARSVPVTCVHPGWAPLHGREAVVESWRGILANPAAPNIRARGATAWVREPVAFVICQEIIEQGRLIATNVFVLEDRDWKIAHHHASPADPMVPAGEAAPARILH